MTAPHAGCWLEISCAIYRINLPVWWCELRSFLPSSSSVKSKNLFRSYIRTRAQLEQQKQLVWVDSRLSSKGYDTIHMTKWVFFKVTKENEKWFSYWYFTQLTVTLLNCRKVWSNLSHISSRLCTIFCKWNHCDGSTSGFSHECYHHSGWICKK